MAKEQDKHKAWIKGKKKKKGQKKWRSADGGSWVKDKEELLAAQINILMHSP